MNLSPEIISRVDNILGFRGNPYQIQVAGWVWEETNAYSWVFPSEELDLQLDPVTYQIIQIDIDDQNKELINLNHQLEKVRSTLEREPVIVYKSIEILQDAYHTFSRTIVVAPYTDTFDAIRIENGQHAGAGFPPEALDWLVAQLKSIDNQYGLDLLGASRDAVELKIERVPSGAEAASLSNRLLSIAPDMVGDHLEFKNRFDFIRNNGRIALWWDDLWHTYKNS